MEIVKLFLGGWFGSTSVLCTGPLTDFLTVKNRIEYAKEALAMHKIKMFLGYMVILTQLYQTPRFLQ